MSGEGVDEAVVGSARAAVVATRQAHFALLTAVAELEASGAGEAAGYGSTTRLVQELWRVDRTEAGRWVDEAADLCARRALSGQPLPARLPASGAAAEAGLIGEAHIRVLRRTMARVGRVEGMDPDTEAHAERLLAEWATQLPPRALERAAARLLATLDPDGVAPPDGAGEDDELQVARRADGSLALKGRITDRVDVEMVLEVLDALSAPAGADDPRSLPQRRVEALKELFAQSLSPTGIATDAQQADDHDVPLVPAPRTPQDDRTSGCPTLPVPGRALLMITMDHRWLQKQIGHGVLDSETALDPATVRRWACDAGVVPTVLGSRSEPLDVGRLSYTVPAGLRRALHHRDGGCAFPGCTRRPRRCAAHHVVHWADGGETSLDNLALLCRFHHTVIHHEQWQVAMIDGRPWFTPPAWLDPTRSPRPGGRPGARRPGVRAQAETGERC